MALLCHQPDGITIHINNMHQFIVGGGTLSKEEVAERSINEQGLTSAVE